MLAAPRQDGHNQSADENHADDAPTKDVDLGVGVAFVVFLEKSNELLEQDDGENDRRDVSDEDLPHGADLERGHGVEVHGELVGAAQDPVDCDDGQQRNQDDTDVVGELIDDVEGYQT